MSAKNDKFAGVGDVAPSNVLGADAPGVEMETERHERSRVSRDIRVRRACAEAVTAIGEVGEFMLVETPRGNGHSLTLAEAV